MDDVAKARDPVSGVDQPLSLRDRQEAGAGGVNPLERLEPAPRLVVSHKVVSEGHIERCLDDRDHFVRGRAPGAPRIFGRQRRTIVLGGTLPCAQ